MMKNKQRYFLAIFLMAGAVGACSQNRNEIGFQTDNDSYLANGSDRYYTNGIFIYYRKALPIKDEKMTDPAKKIFGIEVAQKMYTPKSASVYHSKDIDRPFAGFSYLAVHYNILNYSESNILLSLQLGVLGKASGAESLQHAIHRLFNLYEPHGWEHQIGNYFVINLSSSYNKLLLRKSFFDLTFNSQAHFGN